EIGGIGDAATLPGQGIGAPERMQRADRQEAAGKRDPAPHEASAEAVEQFANRQAGEAGLYQPAVQGSRVERVLRLGHARSGCEMAGRGSTLTQRQIRAREEWNRR